MINLVQNWWQSYQLQIALKQNNQPNEYLPKQFQISSIKKKYLKENWVSHYTIDDYVILAKPKSFSD